MAKPITWQNVNAPNLDLGGMAVALRGFGQASEGFDRLSGRMLEMDALETKGMTNQAIALALRNGGDISQIPTDPRIDTSAVYDVLAHKAALDSDLKTAVAGRNSTRAATARTKIQGLQDQFDLSHAPLLWDREAQAARDASAESGANVAQSKAATARDNLLTQQLRTEATTKQQQEKAVLDIDDVFVADQNKYFDEEMQKVEQIKKMKMAAGMTEEEWQKELPTREANARGLAAERFGRDLPRRALELGAQYNIPRSILSQAGYGKALDEFEATSQADVLAQAAELRDITANRRKYLGETASGKIMTGIALDADGNPIVLTDPNDIDANTVKGGESGIENYIGAKYDISDEDDAKKAVQFASILGNNASYMDSILAKHPNTGYFADERTVDWDAAIETAKSMAAGIKQKAQDELTALPEDTGNISNDDILLKLQREQESAAATAAKAGETTVPAEEEVIPPVSNIEIAKKLAAPKDKKEVDQAAAAFQQNLIAAERELKDIPEEVQKRHLTAFNKLQNTFDYAAGNREKLENPRDSFDPMEAPRSRKLRPYEKAEELDNFATLLKMIRDQEADFQEKKKSRELRDYANESL